MNHCIDCGHRIARGATAATTAVRCRVCLETRTMATFRYLSPAAKKRRARHEEATRRTQRIAAGQMELEI